MIGDKHFELSNHLGNVLAVISDKKIPTTTAGVFNPDVLTYSDYYPFGMLVPNRHADSNKYRYGFNGKENDNEIMGEGNFEDYGMRMYNPRVGRFFSEDPLTKSYPELTPYQFASNTPIQAIDLDGEEKFHYTLIRSDKGKPTLKLSRVENFTETIKEWKPTLTKWFNTETTTVVNPRREYIVHGIATVTYGLDGNGIQHDNVTWTFASKSEMQAAAKHGGPSNYGGWSWSNSDQWMGTAAFIGVFNTIQAETETGNQGSLGKSVLLASKIGSIRPISNNEVIVIATQNKGDNPNNFLLRAQDSKPIGNIVVPGKSATLATESNFNANDLIKSMFGRNATRNDKILGSTVGDIRAAGFDVVRAPTRSNPNHVRIISNTRTFNEEGRSWLDAAFQFIFKGSKN